jgi:hypothetical protein
MIGAAVHDPERYFATVIYRTAKGSLDHGIAVARREGRQWSPFAIYRHRIAAMASFG